MIISRVVKFRGFGGSESNELTKFTPNLTIAKAENTKINNVIFDTISLYIIVFFCAQGLHLSNLEVMPSIPVQFFSL
jgi:hypothetical protein